jgi:dTDP-4-amino-4,6-dideoxygalactose transaminase
MRTDRQFAAYRDEFMGAVESVFSHGQVLQGPEVRHFEKRVADLHGVPHAVAVGSATDALYLSLLATGLKPGGRVAVTAFTFVASASAIVRAGGIPVFVDIGDDYQPDTTQIIDLIESGDLAGVVAVHMFGQMVDLSAVQHVARQYGVFIVEDAAQCFGSDVGGVNAGTWSDAACLSFDPTKIVGAFGSGGAVLTRNGNIAETVARLRYHGKDQSGVFQESGLNSQMASVQAALLDVKLNHLDEWIDKRRDIAERYTSVLDELPGVTPPQPTTGASHVYHKYVLQTDGTRDQARRHLSEMGVSTAIHYDRPLHRQPLFQKLLGGVVSLERADIAADNVLSLPIYPEMSDQEVEHVCSALRSFDWAQESG